MDGEWHHLPSFLESSPFIPCVDPIIAYRVRGSFRACVSDDNLLISLAKNSDFTFCALLFSQQVKACLHQFTTDALSLQVLADSKQAQIASTVGLDLDIDAPMRKFGRRLVDE